MFRSTKIIKGFSKVTSTASVMALTLVLLISMSCGIKTTKDTADFENGLILIIES